MDLAAKYAATTHETAEFVKFYETMDPKVYEDMSSITEFSDEQEVIAKAVYQTNDEGGLNAPRDCALLDVACGTGMFGRLLHK